MWKEVIFKVLYLIVGTLLIRNIPCTTDTVSVKNKY